MDMLCSCVIASEEVCAAISDSGYACVLSVQQKKLFEESLVPDQAPGDFFPSLQHTEAWPKHQPQIGLDLWPSPDHLRLQVWLPRILKIDHDLTVSL